MTELKISWADRRGSIVWHKWSGTLDELGEKFFSGHKTGVKDGECILQGVLIGKDRNGKAEVANYLVSLDHDSGETIDEIAAKIEAAGLWACLYTTHSHLTPYSDIGETAFLKYMEKYDFSDPVEGAKEYLTKVKGIVPAIVSSITNVSRTHTGAGAVFRVEHDPMHKVRSMFILETPFEFVIAGATQESRMKEWGERYEGFAESLGLAIDPKCKDPARLFYTPRRAKDGPPGEIRVIEGTPLRWQDMPRKIDERAEKRRIEKEIDEALGIKGEPSGNTAEFKTPGLRRFLGSPASKYFLAASWLESVEGAPRVVRDDKVHFECPLDDLHTNAGDEKDQGFFAVNADVGNDRHWQMWCAHTTCSAATNGDRALYLDAACVKYGVTDARELLAWCLGYEEKGYAHERAEEITDIGAAIRSLVPGDASNAVRDILGAIALQRPDELALDEYLRAIASKSKISMTALRRAYKGNVREEVAAAEADNAVPERLAPVPDDPSMAGTIWSHWSYEDQITCTLARLVHLNEKSPTLFMRGEGDPVRLRAFDGRPILKDLCSTPAWVAELSDRLTFRQGGEEENATVPPFANIVTYLAGTTRLELPAIDRIVEVPVFSPDGTLRTEKGFDPAGRTLLWPREEFLPVPEVPTEDDIVEALDWLTEPIRDFPFSDDFSGYDPLPIRGEGEDEDGHPLPNYDRGRSSRAHFLAMFLQPFARSLIAGPTPAYLIDKSMPGTGAGELTNVLGMALYGKAMPTEVPSTNEEEFHKAITTSLREGSDTIFLDNINHKLDSGTLASALTSGTWKGRLLSTNTNIIVPVRATWIFAANSGEFSLELMRRIVPIRLDAAVVNPARDRGRGFFKYDPLSDWTQAHRKEMVWAALVLIQNWLAKGSPQWTGEPMRSFEHWSYTIGGILEAAGVEGFLENQEGYLENRVTDEDRADAYVEKLAGDVGNGNPFTLDDAYDAAMLPGVGELDRTLGLEIRARDESGIRLALGQILSKMVGRVYNTTRGKVQLGRATRAHNRARYVFQAIR